MYEFVLEDPKTKENPERLQIASERVAALKKKLQPEAAPPPVAPPPPPPTPPPAAPQTPPQAEPDTADAGASKRVAGYALLGVGGAGLFIGAVTGGLALAQAKSVTKDCHGSLCPAGDKSAADAAMTKGWVSNVSLGIGVVGVVAGAVLLIVNRAPPKTVTATAEGIALRF
jgi:hypothetical protein